MRNGTTIVELLVVLGLLALLGVGVLPASGGARDRIVVRSASNAFAHVLRTARLAARQSGGARIQVELDSARVRLIRQGRPDEVLALATEFGVSIDAPGPRTPELRFDALGLGRFASRTFTLSRGQAVRKVVVSAYGRVERR